MAGDKAGSLSVVICEGVMPLVFSACAKKLPIMMAVHYYYRFKVSLDDVLELMAMRGFYLSHQTVPPYAIWQINNKKLLLSNKFSTLLRGD